MVEVVAPPEDGVVRVPEPDGVVEPPVSEDPAEPETVEVVSIPPEEPVPLWEVPVVEAGTVPCVPELDDVEVPVPEVPTEPETVDIVPTAPDEPVPLWEVPVVEVGVVSAGAPADGKVPASVEEAGSAWTTSVWVPPFSRASDEPPTASVGGRSETYRFLSVSALPPQPSLRKSTATTCMPTSQSPCRTSVWL